MDTKPYSSHEVTEVTVLVKGVKYGTQISPTKPSLFFCTRNLAYTFTLNTH